MGRIKLEEEYIEFLEVLGYNVTKYSDISDLDLVDNRMLSKIQDKFLNSSWEERQRIYNLVKNL